MHPKRPSSGSRRARRTSSHLPPVPNSSDIPQFYLSLSGPPVKPLCAVVPHKTELKCTQVRPGTSQMSPQRVTSTCFPKLFP